MEDFISMRMMQKIILKIILKFTQKDTMIVILRENNN